jgi:hypothetical protein
VILSFLGGARWALALRGDGSAARFAEAVAPSLLGLLALLLSGRTSIALALLAAGFMAWLLIDLSDARWPRAYRRLRLGITGVVLALHAGWLAV